MTAGSGRVGVWVWVVTAHLGWFGQGFLARSIVVGQTLALIGELAPGPGRALANPVHEIIEAPPAEGARSGAPDGG